MRNESRKYNYSARQNRIFLNVLKTGRSMKNVLEKYILNGKFVYTWFKVITKVILPVFYHSGDRVKTILFSFG